MIVRSPRTKRAGDRGTDGVVVGLWLGVDIVVVGVELCVGVGVGLGPEVSEVDGVSVSLTVSVTA